MYHLTEVQVDNCAPWEIPLSKRFSYLKQAIASNCKVAIHIYHHADTSTFRYRVYNIYQFLKKSTEWKSIYFYRYELDYLFPYIQDIDLLIFCRTQWTFPVGEFISVCKHKGIPIVFDIDDLIFDINYFSMITNTLNVAYDSDQHYDAWFSDMSRMNYTASFADFYTSTNQYLCNILTEKYKSPAQVIPNTINTEQIKVSDNYCLQKKSTPPDKLFTLGYFSGSPTHLNDFKTIYMEVLRFMDEFPNTELLVVGFMDFPSIMDELIEAQRVRFVSLVDFLTLQYLIAEIDVNLVPLVNNTFTNCKSELKFFEAAIVDTLTIASPTFTYSKAIQHGVNGYLCKPGEWYATLKDIYLNYADQHDVIECAHAYSLENYAGDKIRRQIENVYTNFYNAYHKT